MHEQWTYSFYSCSQFFAQFYYITSLFFSFWGEENHIHSMNINLYKTNIKYFMSCTAIFKQPKLIFSFREFIRCFSFSKCVYKGSGKVLTQFMHFATQIKDNCRMLSHNKWPYSSYFQWHTFYIYMNIRSKVVVTIFVFA